MSRKRHDPEPLKRRLKSIDDFKRPHWFPRFNLPAQEDRGMSGYAVVVIGLIVGAAIGFFLFV